MKDVYMEKVSKASIGDGVVTIVCGTVEVGPVGDVTDETIRLRIPLTRFQSVAKSFRDVLIGAMKDGWYGDEGRKAAEDMRGSK